MRSLLYSSVLLSLLVVTSATPHPECDPCSSVSGADLNALELAGKYLCCDLTCAYDPQPGCGVFGLPLVCKACYDGEGIPAYDDPPVGETTSPIAAPVATRAPVGTMVGVPKTEPPVGTGVGIPETEIPIASGPTPTPTTPAAVTPTPVVVTPTEFPAAGVVSISTSSPIPSDPVGTPTSMPLSPGGDVTYSPVSVRILTPSPVASSGGSTPVPAASSSTPSPVAVVMDVTPTPMTVPASTPTPITVRASTPSPITGVTSSGVCTAEEEAQCADLTPGQQEALAMSDNGGKIIVCDPTCVDGVSDPIHCNYFGLGQRCRGCGMCDDCTPCP